MSAVAVLVAVLCQSCGRKHCDASPGAVVRFRCKRCGALQIVTVDGPVGT